MLKVHGVDRKLMDEVKVLYRFANAYVKIKSGFKFQNTGGVRQECVISPLLFIVNGWSI